MTSGDWQGLGERKVNRQCAEGFQGNETILLDTIIVGTTYYTFVKAHRMYRASLVAQSVKNLPAMQETRVQFLGGKDPLEKEMATHSSILAWRIPWPGGLQSMGVARVRHNLETKPLP